MKKTIYKSGLSLVEVVVTIAVLLVVSLGAISYQFHAVRQDKNGRIKMAAARLGSLVMESWKSRGGSDAFDPSDLNLGILEIEGSPGKYKMIVDEVPFYVTLDSTDINTNKVTGVTLRRLSVFVQWRPDLGNETPQSSDPGSTFYTYVRQDQSGG